MTGDKKWVYFDNLERKKVYGKRGEPLLSTSKTTLKRSIHIAKAMLCVWCDQKGILFYELLKPGENITSDRYIQQLIAFNRALTCCEIGYITYLHSTFSLMKKSKIWSLRRIFNFITAESICCQEDDRRL